MSDLLRRLTEASPGFSGSLAAHCRWMIAAVSAHPDWPPDKRLRWLGFVAAAVDGSNASELALGRWRDAVLTQSLGPSAEPVVREAHQRVLSGLPVTEDRPTVGLRRACAACPTAAGMAFGVGYLQGVLASRGLLDVKKERDRTRPIFHRAYRRCGWAVPETLLAEGTPEANQKRGAVRPRTP